MVVLSFCIVDRRVLAGLTHFENWAVMAAPQPVCRYDKLTSRQDLTLAVIWRNGAAALLSQVPVFKRLICVYEYWMFFVGLYSLVIRMRVYHSTYFADMVT